MVNNMKYNKSKIMKRAWELKKENGITMSKALKSAWAEAKGTVVEFKNNMRIVVNGVFYVLKRWTKTGHDRVYVNDGTRKGCGYVDIANREDHTTFWIENKELVDTILNMKFA